MEIIKMSASGGSASGGKIKFLKTFLLLALFFVMPSFTSAAATYYASPSGSGSTCSQISPCALNYAVGTKMGSGDTLVLLDGTYSSGTINAVPNGSSSTYTIIKADHDGGAILTADGAMQLDSKSYIQIEGIKFKYAGEKYISGARDDSATSALNLASPAHHIKVLRCAFEGALPTDNNHNFAITFAHHILVEDCWVYGLGGRYTLMTQASDEIIFRRVVVRKDGGWTGSGNSDPEAGIAIYNTSNTLLQNVIIVDSQAAYTTDWYGGLFLVSNGSTNLHPNDFVTVESSVILNTLDRGILTNAGVSNATFSNVVVANIKKGPGNIARFVTAKASDNINFDKTTLVDYPAYNTSGQVDFDYQDGSTGFTTNTVVYGMTGGDAQTTFDSGYGLSQNPYAAGLLYLTRKENPSTLRTLGFGADVTTKIGSSGTLWGDAGYNTDTGANLWPWPNENRIKADFASVSTRGFTAVGATSNDGSPQTLTKYIWESLGNKIPDSIYGTFSDVVAPSAPTGLSVQ